MLSAWFSLSTFHGQLYLLPHALASAFIFSTSSLQTTTSLDTNLLFFACAFVFCAYVQLCHWHQCRMLLSIWERHWSWRNTIKIKYAKAFILSSHWPFALYYMNLNAGLVIAGSREHLSFLRRIVVLDAIIVVITPPIVSIPRLSG